MKKSQNWLINKENQLPTLIKHTTQPPINKFGTKIKNRVSNSYSVTLQNQDSLSFQQPSNNQHSTSMISLTQSLCFDKKGLDQTVDQDKSLMCLKIDLKRTKSVRFNQQPIEAVNSLEKRTSTKTLVPILKNSTEKLLSSSQSKNLTSSYTSHMGSQKCIFASVGTIISNNIQSSQKKKFSSNLESLKKNKKKYFDDLFPPGAASLYYNPRDCKFGQVRWMRITQIFKGYNICLFNQKQLEKSNIISGQIKIPYMVSSFSSISHSNKLLERIFQDQKYNQMGIYCLRLFHEGIWKYITIDDHIPVVTKQKKNIPLFLNVFNAKKEVQIWPFLLQKALAKIYSTYESLIQYGNVTDLMNEISGAMVQTINTKKQNSQYQLRKYFLNSQSLILVTKKGQNYLPAFTETNKYQKNMFQQLTQDISIKVQDPNKMLNPTSKLFTLSQLVNNFSQAIVCRLNYSFYSVGCTIKQGIKDSYSIRQFTIENSVNCDISLIQKDRKYFRNTNYAYSWSRLMIVMKEKQGYRWINGGFSKKKSIHLMCLLDPGTYFAIVMVDWGSRIYDINLNYNGNYPINFERKTISQCPNILQQTCIDLAQRFGDFKQLSPNLCSYRHVDYFNGFIIQNINNENNKKQVAIIKSYEKAFGEVGDLVIPLNSDFIKNRNVISTKIKPKQNYTLILKVKGNQNLHFMDHFIFDQ